MKTLPWQPCKFYLRTSWLTTWQVCLGVGSVFPGWFERRYFVSVPFFPFVNEEFISSVAGAQPLLHFYFCFHFCVSRLLVTSQFKPHNV